MMFVLKIQIQVIKYSEKEQNDETTMSTFELACQTPENAGFIKNCIDDGYDVNKVSNQNTQNQRFD